MNRVLEQEKQIFLNQRVAEQRHATQYAALQICCNIDLHQLMQASISQQKITLIRLNRLIKRERLKGLNKHWSYDLNRHIALQEVRKLLLSATGNTCQTL